MQRVAFPPKSNSKSPVEANIDIIIKTSNLKMKEFLMKKQENEKEKNLIQGQNIQIENQIAEHRKNPHYLYLVEDYNLSNDTPENRFLKYALEEIIRKYEFLKRKIESLNNASNILVNEMKIVLSKLKRLQMNPFFRTIGPFKGIIQENLILQKAAGYNQVYRIWTILRRAYSIHTGLYRLQTKDIATLYEIWCFIEISHIIRDVLNINAEGIDHINRMEMNGLFTWGLGKGQHSRIIFKKDNIELAELIYNPKHSEYINDNLSIENIVVPTVSQKPDIVLQLTKNDIQSDMKLTYLFDAKYRIDGRVNGIDIPPEDAINQMHRYRDAIYYKENNDSNLKKEVIGGYILFPGDGNTDEISLSKFYKSISEVNIGAFPLRPKDTQNKVYLINFIRNLIGLPASDILEDTIPQKGLYYHEGEPKYFIANIISKINNKQALIDGTATSYHCCNKGPMKDIDIKSIHYFAPINNNIFRGYYKVESVVTHEFPEEKYPVRLELKLSKYTKLSYPVKYGIQALAARGVAFSKEKFFEYCKKHEIR